MKSLSSHFDEKPIFMTGVGLLAAVSSLFFLQPADNWRGNDPFTYHFFFAYMSFIGMFIAILVDNKRQTGRVFRFHDLSNNLILLLLGSASAYALNRDVKIFERSADWLCWFLVVLNLAVLQVGFRKKMEPDWLNHLSVAILSAGLLYGAYGTIFLAHIPFLGLLFFWVFGLSLHLFMPIWWLTALGMLLWKLTRAFPAYRKSVMVGFALPLMLIIGFVVRWKMVGDAAAKVYHEEIAPLEARELPSWVPVGQRIQRDWMTERILGAEVSSRNGLDFIFPSGVNTPDGELRHDPLVGIASVLCPDAGLNRGEARQLKDALFESRHNTEARLWSGGDLRTHDVVTNVEFFPEYRLSYTEKTLTIKHLGGWPTTQEAIYSFYLPEGGVVTSASLWIEGKEQKALLTTREKADSAYTTIVGVEQRDPLLVHWQEGNRITARIFPCSPDDMRQFKIGFTVPLKMEGEELVYENIPFDGPNSDKAEETIRLVGDVAPIESSINFSEQGGVREHQSRYTPDWSLQLFAPPLAEQPFTFNGKSFQLRPLPEVLEPFSYRQVYLDLHRDWSRREFNQIWEAVKTKEVFACPKGCVRLTEQNRSAVFEEMNELNFSIFPLHKIEKPEDAVVVTLHCQGTPVPGDLKSSLFFERFSEFFSGQKKPVRVLNLGEKTSSWFLALAESRAVQVHAAPAGKALELIENQRFPANQEDAETIVLSQAGIKIKQIPLAGGSAAAPDHLMRLFVYNDLMKGLGKNYFNSKTAAKEMVTAAQEAWVVTPFSSLVTLETQADYDRFGIESPGSSSLQNASIKNSGAVPEPQEWLLVILLGGLTLVLYRKTTNNTI